MWSFLLGFVCGVGLMLLVALARVAAVGERESEPMMPTHGAGRGDLGRRGGSPPLGPRRPASGRFRAPLRIA